MNLGFDCNPPYNQFAKGKRKNFKKFLYDCFTEKFYKMRSSLSDRKCYIDILWFSQTKSQAYKKSMRLLTSALACGGIHGRSKVWWSLAGEKWRVVNGQRWRCKVWNVVGPEALIKPIPCAKHDNVPIGSCADPRGSWRGEERLGGHNEALKMGVCKSWTKYHNL